MTAAKKAAKGAGRAGRKARQSRRPASDKRAEPRHTPGGATFLTVTMKRRRYRARIRDLSLGGLRLEIEIEGGCPEAVGKISIAHPAAGRLRGACVWQESSVLGVSLEMPKRELERALQCICLLLDIGGAARTAA